MVGVPKSPDVFSIKKLSDYNSAVQEYPDAILWAGGTYLMSQPDSYPTRDNTQTILYLGELEELKNYQRNDRLIEYGALVPLSVVLTSNRTILPKLLEDDILSVGSSLITSRATIGGAISTKRVITSFPGTLIALNANVEFRYLKHNRVHSKWMPLSHTLDKNGKISLPPKSLVSRIRISINNAEIQKFYSIDSPMLAPERCVIMAFASDWSQDTLNNPHLVITFPKQGICYSRDLDNVFSSVRFPLDDEEYASLESIILTFIDSQFPDVSELQKSRVKGMLEKLVDELNKRTLVMPSMDEEKEE